MLSVYALGESSSAFICLQDVAHFSSNFQDCHLHNVVHHCELALQVILNHVVPAEFRASNLFDAIENGNLEAVTLSTLLSPKLHVTSHGNSLYLAPMGTGAEQSSKVLVTDVRTCAGTLHVVDSVLVPAEGAEWTSTDVSGKVG